MNGMKWTVAAALAALCVFPARMSPAEPLIKGAGATFPAPLYQKWFAEYGAKNGVRFEYQPIGSGGGIETFREGTVDFGAVDGPLSPRISLDEKTTLAVPTAICVVAIVYNVPGVPSGLKLTPELLAEIYLGHIRSWDDPAIKRHNPNIRLPHMTIEPMHQSSANVPSEALTQLLSTHSPEWKRSVGSGMMVRWPVGMGAKGCAGVAAMVRDVRGAIGYVEAAYAVSNVMTVAAVRNRHGRFLLPTIAGGTAAATSAKPSWIGSTSLVDAPVADAYPICALTWLLVRRQPNPILASFLHWVLDEGQKDEGALSYAPLPRSLADAYSHEVDGALGPGAPASSQS